MVLEPVDLPAAEPVSLAEMKAHLRLDYDEEDELLTQLIATARIFLEKKLAIRFMASRWRYRPEITPRSGASITMPLFPVASVQSIKLFLDDGTLVLADLSSLDIVTTVRPAKLCHIKLPSMLQVRHGMEISFTAGYGTLPEDVPAPMRLAIKQLAAHFFENRFESPGCDATGIPASISALLADVVEVRLI